VNMPSRKFAEIVGLVAEFIVAIVMPLRSSAV